MTNDPSDDAPALLAAAFTASLAGEPPLRLDLDALERTAGGRLRRRRTYAISGVAAAVATLTVGATLGAPRMADLLRPAAPSPVPGCATVLRTTDPAFLSWKYGTEAAGWPTYADTADTAPTSTQAPASSVGDAGLAAEDPAPSWFTTAKASSMSKALTDALPTGAELEPLRLDDKASGEPLPYAPHRFPGGAAVVRDGGRAGLLTVSSQYWNLGVPPCTEVVTLRYTAPDGTVADVESWGDPANPTQITAYSFHADGTYVSVDLTPVQGVEAGPLPLTALQLAEIATAPGLSITG